MLRVFQWLTLLSLDAPLVAVGWQSLLAQASGSAISWQQRAVVFLSVWLGYTADRWFDTLRSPAPRTDRHRFAFRNASRLLPLWTLVLAIAVTLSYQTLSSAELGRGTLLVAGAILYTIFAQKSRHLPYYGTIKALFVATLVCASSALFVEVAYLQSFTGAVNLGLVALLFFSNCLCIRAWETPDSHAATLQPFAMIATSLCSLAAIALLPEARAVSSCTFVSISSLWVLHQRRAELSNSACRSLADVCLLWPFLFVAFA